MIHIRKNLYFKIGIFLSVALDEFHKASAGYVDRNPKLYC